MKDAIYPILCGIKFKGKIMEFDKILIYDKRKGRVVSGLLHQVLKTSEYKCSHVD